MSALGQKQISTSMEFGPLSAISRHSCLRHNRGERSFAHDAPEGAALLRLPAQQLRGRVLLMATTTAQSVRCPRHLATPIGSMPC